MSNRVLYPLPLPTPRFIASALLPRVRTIGDTFNPVNPNAAGIIAILNSVNRAQSSGGTFDPYNGVPKIIPLNLTTPAMTPAPAATPAPMSTGEKVAIGAGAVGAIGLLVWAIKKR